MDIAKLLATKIIEKETADPYHRREPHKLHVSDLLYCPRKAFFNMTFAANPIPTGRQIIGKILHRYIQEIIQNEIMPNYKVETEVELEYPVDETRKVVGRADIIIHNTGTMIEIKTTKGGLIHNEEMKATAYQQANIYAYMYQHQHSRPIKEIVLLIIKADNPTEITQHTHTPDSNSAKAALETAKDLFKMIEQKIVPPGPKFTWECKQCTYNIICIEGKKWLLQNQLPT